MGSATSHSHMCDFEHELIATGDSTSIPVPTMPRHKQANPEKVNLRQKQVWRGTDGRLWYSHTPPKRNKWQRRVCDLKPEKARELQQDLAEVEGCCVQFVHVNASESALLRMQVHCLLLKIIEGQSESVSEQGTRTTSSESSETSEWSA